MKVCLIQNKPINDKLVNFFNLEKMIPDESFDLLMFPECFNSLYGIEYFEKNAEEIKKNNLTFDFLEKISLKYNKSVVIAGSIPEKYNNKYYNTCTIWKEGKIIDKYRKINLFDNNIPEASFKESKVLSPGKEPCIVETSFGKIGIGICFDIRFNNISNFYAKNKCKIICYPASFTEFTGDLHWELLNRSRAIDSRTYILSCATALNQSNNFKSYGNSIIVSPWGKVLNRLDNNEGIIIQNIDLDEVKNINKQIPVDQNKFNFI